MNKKVWNDNSLVRVSVVVVVLLLGCLFEIGIAKDSTQLEKNEYYQKKYNFSRDLFTYNVPVWEKILAHLKGKPNINYLEIGVFEGGSALWVLENILTHPTSKMTCIDPFPGRRLDVFLSNLILSGFSKKVTILRGYSQVELRKLSFSTFDIVYIDGSHTAKNVLTDAVLSWDLLKTGGIMIFDDYNWGKELPEVERPKIAIDSFMEVFKGYFKIIYQGWQVMLKKL